MGTQTKYRRFNRTLTNAFRACAPLLALTGHASDNIRILIKTPDASVPLPSLMFTAQHRGNLLESVDDGYMRTNVLAEAFAKDRAVTLEIMGAVEQYVKQNTETYADFGFQQDNIEIRSIRFLGVSLSGESPADEFSGVFISMCELEAIWLDTEIA